MPSSTLMLRPRRGVTLIEMMIAIILFVSVFGLAVPFFRVQTRSVSASAGRLDALQTARYAQNAIDRDLRVAGTGVLAKQPMIVQAAANAVTFNADLTTNDTLDFNAVFYDPDVDSTMSVSMSAAHATTLPLSSVLYPQADYTDASGAPGTAETISYWVEPDSASGRSDQYVLYRSVNGQGKRVVAAGLIVPAGHAFFTYFRSDSVSPLDSIRTADLPLYHSAAIHGSPSDTGKAAWPDAIRAVGMTVTGIYQDPDKGPILRTVQTTTRLLNAGMLQSTVCGDPPLPPTGQTATYEATPSPAVTIQWSASVDQDNGEKDVARYLIFKRPVGSSSWGEAITSLQAALSSYTFDDTDLSNGTWEYGIAAQDCSPANSPMAVTGPVTVALP